MRIVELKYKNSQVTLHTNGTQSSIDEIAPMEMIVTAIAKDILEEIKSKANLMQLELNDYSVQVTLRTNEEKEKSKIIETQLKFNDNLSVELKNKFQKIADRAHLKRMLGNEIVFQTTQLK